MSKSGSSRLLDLKNYISNKSSSGGGGSAEKPGSPSPTGSMFSGGGGDARPVGLYGATATPPPKPKKERRISLLYPRGNGKEHTNGISSLLLSPDASTLYTASRDATVKSWDLERPSPTFLESYDGHIDWVNDIALMGNTLVSCSSDKTLKVWNGAGPNEGQCLRTLIKHQDYVMALAAAPQAGLVASGGLGGEVFLWDLHAASSAPVVSTPLGGPGRGGVGRDGQAGAPAPSYEPVPCEGHRESVYSLAMNASGTMLVSGSSEKVVRVWDPRTGTKQMKLKGHTDNIRALVLDSTGRMCLSGAADNTIKLWDLGQQRCVQTFRVHHDSVWCLAVDSGFTQVYSGGRDGGVYATSLATRESALLVQEETSVLHLALDEAGQAVWTGTVDSGVRKWSAAVPEDRRAIRGSFVAGASPYQRSFSMRQQGGEAERPTPIHTSPVASIRGAPGIVRHAVMNDRRHVLTKDAVGCVSLWDIVKGEVVEEYGEGADFDATRKELFQAVSVPAWLSLDTRTGSLAIHLEAQQCFSTEMYAADLGIPDASDELKLNLGEQVLRSVLQTWVERHKRRRQERLGGEGDGRGFGAEGAGVDEGVLATPPFELGGLHVMAESAEGEPWRRAGPEFDGSEGDEMLPQWVVDCVLHRRVAAREQPKCSFYLHPGEGCNFPLLSQTKLSAPRILRIGKVINYVVNKLELGEEAGVDPTGARVPGARGLEVTCNDVVLPLEMSLATVKHYVWKKSDDLELFYRWAVPGAPVFVAPKPED